MCMYLCFKGFKQMNKLREECFFTCLGVHFVF